MGCLKVGEVSIDGTKIRANASKHNALSLSRANQLERRFRREAQRMLELAEAADREDQDDGFNLPEELALREDRIRAIKEAKERIRVRETERMAQERSDREAARAERKAFEAVDGRRFQRQDNGHAPKRNPNAQINLTDEDSRIMMSSEGFVQAYNGQLAVDCDSMLVAACHVTQRTTDSLQIKPMLEALTTSPIGKPTALLADAGYHSELNVERCAANDVEPYIAFGREPHHWGTTTLETPETARTERGALTQMLYRLRTPEGRAIYAKRKSTVEPVIGNIKRSMGFRQFSLRGIEKAGGEWTLVCASWNLRRLHALSQP